MKSNILLILYILLVISWFILGFLFSPQHKPYIIDSEEPVNISVKETKYTVYLSWKISVNRAINGFLSVGNADSRLLLYDPENEVTFELDDETRTKYEDTFVSSDPLRWWHDYTFGLVGLALIIIYIIIRSPIEVIDDFKKWNKASLSDDVTSYKTYLNDPGLFRIFKNKAERRITELINQYRLYVHVIAQKLPPETRQLYLEFASQIKDNGYIHLNFSISLLHNYSKSQQEYLDYCLKQLSNIKNNYQSFGNNIFKDNYLTDEEVIINAKRRIKHLRSLNYVNDPYNAISKSSFAPNLEKGIEQILLLLFNLPFPEGLIVLSQGRKDRNSIKISSETTLSNSPEYPNNIIKSPNEKVAHTRVKWRLSVDNGDNLLYNFENFKSTSRVGKKIFFKTNTELYQKKILHVKQLQVQEVASDFGVSRRKKIDVGTLYEQIELLNKEKKKIFDLAGEKVKDITEDLTREKLEDFTVEMLTAEDISVEFMMDLFSSTFTISLDEIQSAIAEEVVSTAISSIGIEF